MGFVGAGFELRVVLYAHEEGPAGKLDRLYQPAVRGHTGKGKASPGKDIPIVIIELISVAVALGYTACTVAALHGGAWGYFAGILPKAQRAALIYIFALSGHKVYNLVPAKLIKFSGMCV